MKKNFWPYGIILAFVLFIGGTVGLIVFACAHPTDLVNANYYEQEIKYQARLDSLERVQRLASPATVSYDGAESRIIIKLPAEHAMRATDGKIELYRPSAAGEDKEIRLLPDVNGIQVCDVARLESGLWKVLVVWKVNGEEFCLDQKIVIGKKS